MKEAKVVEFKVGIFVAVGLIAFMVSILLLGGSKVAFTRYNNYSSQFDEVQGLFPGSIVSLAGLPIGNVKSIQFSDKQNKLKVVFEIDRKFADRIVEGTTSEVRTQGALGDKYVYLSPGPVGAKVLDNGTDIPFSDSGDILKMLASKDDGVGQALALIKEVKILVASLNQDNKTAKTMDNLNSTITQLRSTLGQTESMIRDIHGELPNDKKFRQSIISLASILEKIDQGKGSLGLFVNDPSIHQRLKNLLGGSQRNEYLKDMIRTTIQQNESGKK